MANTTLRAYLDELNLLLEQEALEEVIGHCRHILQHFPKNVETYRILGRALLDRQRYDEANDVFQRVLGAVPDDFVSHLGLSSVAEEQGQLPAALWHAECAYEQDSSNNAIKDELKRLYERRDGAAPERIQMTRGALVRTYFKSRLYDQAANEARIALKQTPERIDLLLLLAQIFWEGDHPVEAGETALQVLEKLPNALEANRILAALWIRNGRPAEAAPFMARLEQLDPFVAWQTAQPDGKPIPGNAFQLPHLDWDARTAAALATDVPDWVNSISNVFDAPDQVSLSDSSPSWFDGDVESAAPQAAPKRPSSRLSRMGASEPEPIAEPPVEMPDWAQDFLGDSSTANTGEDIPDWFKDTPKEVVDNAIEGMPDLPDWFAEAVNTPQVPPLTPAPESVNRPADQLPSGFTDLLEGDTTFGSASGNLEPAAASDFPDWLTDELIDTSTSAASTPSIPPSQPLDAMSWLATGPLPPLEEAAPTLPQAPADANLDWLNESPSATAEPAAETAGSIEDFNLDWLGNAPGAAPAAESEPVSAANDLDWLNDNTNAASPAPTSAEAGELNLDWVASSEPTAAAQPAEAGSLDWLSDTSGTPPSAAESVSAADDQDWLSGIGSVESTPTAEPVEAGDLNLDWLGDAASPAVSAETEPAQASDLDWLTGSPNREPTSIGEPVSAVDDLDWLSEPPNLSQSAVVPPAADSSQDWLSSIASPELASAVEPAAENDLDRLTGTPSVEPTAAEPKSVNDMGLDWLGDTSSVEETPAEPVAASEADWLTGVSATQQHETEPAEAGEISLDWLGGTPSPEPATEVAPAEAGGLDWLSSMPSAEPPAVEPTEADDISLDWLGGTPSPEPTAEAAPAEAGGLDWLSSMPSAEPPAVEPTEADDISLDWLGGTPSPEPTAEAAPAEAGGLDWLSSLPSLESTAEVTPDQPTFDLGQDETAEPEAAEIGDPMAWLRPYQGAVADEGTSITGASTEQAQEFAGISDEEPLAPSERPDWLSTIAPAQPASESLAEPTAEAETLDWLASSPSTPTSEDWLGALGAESQAAAEPAQSMDHQPQPESRVEPEIELEDEWLAAFEIGTETPGEPPAYSTETTQTAADEGEAWQMPVESSPVEPAASDWLNTLTADSAPTSGASWTTEEPAQQPAASDDWLGSLGASQPVTPETTADSGDDWLSSFRAAEPAAEESAPAWMSTASADTESDWTDKPAETAPAWMMEAEPTTPDASDAPPPEPDDHFERLLKQAAGKANEPRIPGETGVLNPDQVPDWMAAFGGEASAEPVAEGMAEPDASSDWSSPSFGTPAADIHETVAAGEGTPDWLADMAPGRQTMPAQASTEELDFSSLDFIEQDAEPAAGSTQSDFNFEQMFADQGQSTESVSPVAQPANLVNTSGDVVQAAQPGQSFTFDFSFDHKPAWMRKRGAAGGHAPRWMKKTTDAANDLPDWLKE